ncbi:N-hydroxyarylamine O-acetyltransferase [Saccharicrinis carchari]|uniref:N-hydroxyarylamine O-acetyltransferase n=1 Tax=Saccharicrinis carchari TaxID=1168039 RepID=A0A521EDM4_SACCC|nr:arylamine N-acetyltransferase [Saccharicrinis carchari]SMO81290.1 N-hydroxyarylamine O-acetyltransferase [Saccharicrinis carchari]
MREKTKPTHIRSDNFSLQSYLYRVKYSGTPKSDYDSIKKLMQCQMCSVPFENLDVQKGMVVSLLPNDIVDKILNKHRGGYCYEVNGLFALALQEIKVPYIFVAARPMPYPERRPNTHMAIIATIENEEFLIDLGFGSYGIREPLKLSSYNTEIVQGKDAFMLEKTAENEYLLKTLINKEWANQYSFEVHHHEWIDFIPANYFNSTHPDSIFVQKPFVVLFNANGRKVLFGNTLKLIEDGSTESILFEEEEYEGILKQHFNLQP